MLNILFWNLHKTSIGDYISKCIAENDIDLAIFSEYDGIDLKTVEKSLGSMYTCVEVQVDTKVVLLAKATLTISIKHEQHRYIIYRVNSGIKEYILAAVHLQDRRNYSTSDRVETIRSLVSDIEEAEKELGCTNTIIIGDINANPYDEELLSKYAFNAVLFKSIIHENEFTNPKSATKKRRFYNPIIHYLSEETQTYGSFYYENNFMTPYWYCLDQVLVRRSLVNHLQHVKYLKSIDESSLVSGSKKTPEVTISDHLPLLVNLMEVGDGV